MVRKGEFITDILVKEAKKELQKLEKMLVEIEEFQKFAPAGCLKYQNKGKKTYFYHQYWDENNKKWERKYIKKEDLALARNLAKKQYYFAVKSHLKKNVEALWNLIRQYHPKEVERIYDRLSVERKKLVEPLMIGEKERIRQWNLEQFESNNFHPENLRFETEQGESVRSKSEVIIANILYQHRNDILYKYEKPLEVLVNRKIKTIYPDFTIMNIHTGKISYWEHAGRMDDPVYANEFVKKTNIYMANDLMPGKDVFFSYESLASPLEISAVRKLVEELLVD